MTACAHTPTGVVTSDPERLQLADGETYAQTPVCDLPECFREAVEWVHRLTGKPPAYLRSEVGSSFPVLTPEHPEHTVKTVKMGRPLKPGDFYHAVGNFQQVEYVRQDMQVPWMNRDGIRECIPPAYTEFIGKQLMQHINDQQQAAA